EQVERADDTSLPAQRHDDLGPRSGNRLDVARIRVHVVDEDRLPLGDGGANQPVPHLEAQPPDDVVRVADGVGDRQLLAARIEQVDGKGLELGDAGDELRDLVEQLVEVEDGGNLSPQLEERHHELARVRRSRSGGGGVCHEITSIIASLRCIWPCRSTTRRSNGSSSTATRSSSSTGSPSSKS